MLSGEEWKLLLAAVPLVLAIRTALWLLPSRSIVWAARGIAKRAPRPGEPSARAASIVWAVDAASRRIPHASCLTQALSAQMLLLWHGHHAEICVGVARDTDGEFRAHAWLEREGRVIIGGAGSRDFTRLPGLALGGYLSGAGVKR